MSIGGITNRGRKGVISNMKTNKDDVALIDRAYQGKCDDYWEHFHGITIETTDNPGWLATLDWAPEVKWEIIMQELKGEFCSCGGLEYCCDKEGNKLRVFCTTLSDLLERVARILKKVNE